MSCTTILAGKKTTESGFVIAAHNEDERGRYVTYHGMLPERDWDLTDPDQAFLPAEPGYAKVPQVSHTFRTYWVEHVYPDCGAENSDMFLNRNGVLFTSNAGGDSKPDPNDPSLVKDGGIGYNIRRAVGERAENARHGVQIALSLIAEWGYAPTGRCYTIADKDEAWIIQVVRGFYYAAARIPDDAVMVMPNHLTIHSLTEFPVSIALDPHDPQVPMNTDWSQGAILYPADLISHAEEQGWYTPVVSGKTDDFDYAWVYQKGSGWKNNYNTNRHLIGMRYIMDDPKLECPADPLAGIHNDPDTRYFPLCVYPKQKVTLEKIAKILAEHQALTPDAWAELGPGRTPHIRRGLICCYGNSAETTMAQFAESPERTTLWTALGRSCHQPFIPLHPLNGIPEILEPHKDPSQVMHDHLLCRPERTCWQNNAWWQGFRVFQELADMQFCDVEEDLHELRFAHLAREKEANERILAENGDLAAFDREHVEIALKEWKAFAEEHFNLAEIEPHEPVSKAEAPAEIGIRFRMPAGQTPREEGLVLAQGMALMGTEQADVIPGSLQQETEDIWTARFAAENILNRAWAAGDFDYYLGGLNTDGRTFAGQVILRFL